MGDSALRVRFLIDNALPPLLAELLLTAGRDAVHVRAYNMQAPAAKLSSHGRCRKTASWRRPAPALGAILANQEANRPSFILCRDPNLLAASDYATMLVPALTVLKPELVSGCLAVFRNGRL